MKSKSRGCCVCGYKNAIVAKPAWDKYYEVCIYDDMCYQLVKDLPLAYQHSEFWTEWYGPHKK